jgi:hypothetical protein
MPYSTARIIDFIFLSVEFPYHAGSLEVYIPKTNEANEMEMKVFGCRHYQARSLESAVMSLSQKGDGHRRKRFIFNGLISHVKA